MLKLPGLLSCPRFNSIHDLRFRKTLRNIFVNAMLTGLLFSWYSTTHRMMKLGSIFTKRLCVSSDVAPGTLAQAVFQEI